MTAKIILIINREHEARVIQAIRLRRANERVLEESFRVVPRRDNRGRFAREAA